MPWPMPRRSLTPTSCTTAGSRLQKTPNVCLRGECGECLCVCACVCVCVCGHRLGNTPLSRLPISPPECVHALTRTSAFSPAPCRAVCPWPCTCASTFLSCTACATCPVRLFARGVCGSNTTHLSPQNTGARKLGCSSVAHKLLTVPPPHPPRAPHRMRLTRSAATFNCVRCRYHGSISRDRAHQLLR